VQHLGEIISLVVAASWTVTALFADKASHRMGSMSANVLRLSMAVVFLALILWVSVGHPYPVYANGQAWLWLALSALVGYVFGDWCLFNCYLSIGARFGQLLMTLAPPMAAIAGWLLLGESLSWTALIAMVVTLTGIGISILSRGEGHKVKLTLPLKGILLGVGAGIGQGVGLVLSKIGLTHYLEALMALQKDLGRLKAAVHDATGMRYALVMTLFGPVVGVSLSLMAVEYTNAGIASTLMALTPVLILIPYAFIYKQKIRPREILGVTVSMVGVALFFLL